MKNTESKEGISGHMEQKNLESPAMNMRTDPHIVRRFDQQLAQLRGLVLEMGGLVESQVKQAVQALDEEDLDDAREVIDREDEVNAMEIKADEACTNLLALRQPVGSDLRTILALLRTVNDLERIGDEAEKIARMAVRLYDTEDDGPSTSLLRDVLVMAKSASAMLRGCLDALARLDVERAVDIAQGDDQLDEEFQSSVRRLITYMMEDPRTIGHAIGVLFILKALERVGDHSKNIAEHVIYLVKGKDVRHLDTHTLSKSALKRE